MKRLQRLIVLVLGAAAAVSVGAPARTERARAGGPQVVPEAMLNRLAGLDPADPLSYFSLGEEFAELSSGRARELARQLYVLAYELDRRSSPSMGLGPSVCLGLGALSSSADERRWLRAMGETLAPARASVTWQPALQPAATDDGAYELAVAVGRYRSQEFRRVRETLNRLRSSRDLLVRAGLDESEADGLVKQLASEVEGVSSCPGCRNERVLRGQQDGKPSVRLCPVCRGNPGPTPALSPERFALQLRAEALLLGASAATWSAQSQLDRGRAFRDVDPAGLAAYAGVDPERCVWRDGAWVRP